MVEPGSLLIGYLRKTKEGCAPQTSSFFLPSQKDEKYISLLFHFSGDYYVVTSVQSLQNLEISTMDSLRQVVDRTHNLGENMKHKYGSRVEMTRGKYDKLQDEPDPDSEEELPARQWQIRVMWGGETRQPCGTNWESRPASSSILRWSSDGDI